MEQRNISKWISQSEYVDTHTGEILTKQTVEKEYLVIGKTKRYTFNEQFNKKTQNYETVGTITYTNECQRAGKQTKLFN